MKARVLASRAGIVLALIMLFVLNSYAERKNELEQIPSRNTTKFELRVVSSDERLPRAATTKWWFARTNGTRRLDPSALTPKDIADMAFFAQFADMGGSVVRTAPRRY